MPPPQSNQGVSQSAISAINELIANKCLNYDARVVGRNARNIVRNAESTAWSRKWPDLLWIPSILQNFGNAKEKLIVLDSNSGLNIEERLKGKTLARR